MVNPWGTNGGIYLGFKADSTQGQPPPLAKASVRRYTGDRHIVLTGPNGSGKTMRYILPALVDLVGWSFLVNDIKGDLYKMTAKHRAAAGNLIVKFDPFGTDSHGFNPIISLETGDNFPDDAMELAEAVVRVESREPHWAQAAQELVSGLIMYIRLIMPETGSFIDVRKMLGLDHLQWRRLVRGGKNTDPRQYELWEMTPEEDRDANYEPPFEYEGKFYPGANEVAKQHDWPQLETKLARYGYITPANREMLSVISTALTQTRWLDSVHIAAEVSKNKFDFSMVRERPVTVYMILPPRRLSTHSAWLRMCIASFLQKLMVVAKPGKVPVMLLLDEFAAIAGGVGAGRDDNGDGFPVVARNMPLFRQYGIKLLTAWQDLGQAKRIYGDGFESFIANAGVFQNFAPQDVITAEHLSKMTGQKTVDITTGSEALSTAAGRPEGEGSTTTLSDGLIPMPLMLPQDFRNMHDGFTVVFSHQAKDGPVTLYLPYPDQLEHLKEICALDSA